MSASPEPRFDYPNDSIERTVRIRFTLASLPLGPVSWTIAVLLSEHLPRGGASSQWLLAVMLLSVTVAIGIFGYFGMARVGILLSVPKAIAIGTESVVGDFRREGWKGHPVREIRFDDIQGIGRTRVLRIPILRGHPNYKRRKPIMDSSFFYLSPANLETVRKAVQARGASSGP